MLRALDRRLRAVRLAWLFWPLFLVQLALVVLFPLTLLLPREARLTVQATTQVLSFRVAKGEVFDGWGDLHPARALTDAETCERPVVSLDPQIAGPLAVVMQTTPEGELSMSFEGPGRFGTLDCGKGTIPVASSLILSWQAQDAASLALPFRGHLVLGGNVNTGTSTPRLLLGGTVRVEASGVMFSSGQVTSEDRLYVGDRFYLSDGAGNDDQAIAHGIVAMAVTDEAERRPAMEVTAHATAAEAKVLHHGQTTFAGTSFAPTFWAKLQAQPEWALLLVLGAVLLNMVTQLQTYLVERGVERALPAVEEDTP